MSLGWTEERVELLKKLWLEGLSASQIAGVLGGGTTRNAVISKVHRLKLGGRATPARNVPSVRAARARVPRAMPRPTARLTPPFTNGTKNAVDLKIKEEFETGVDLSLQAAELFIPVEQRLVLLALNEHTCKWPIGDPLTSDFYFCGQHVEGKNPYCEFHSRRAYYPIDKKKRGKQDRDASIAAE